MLDQQEAPGPRMEDLIADRDLLNRLIKRLRELDPDADTILALWQEDCTMSAPRRWAVRRGPSPIK